MPTPFPSPQGINLDAPLADSTLASLTCLLVIATFFLGFAALAAPYISQQLRRTTFAPKLIILFEPNPPYCIKTYWRSRIKPSLVEPVFYCRLFLLNQGQSPATGCEVVLEQLWTYDASGKPAQLPYHSPQNLDLGIKTINPNRTVICPIGHVSSSAHQQREERPKFIDIPGHHADELRFLFDQKLYPYNQPNSLVPGKYVIKISVYSNNAPQEQCYYSIHWSGNWQDSETDMFRELVIRPCSPPCPPNQKQTSTSHNLSTYP